MLLTVLVFALVGAAAQMVDGTLGMGFGVTSATLLTLLGYSAVAASAGTHAAKMGTTFVSGISHWREGNVDFRVMAAIAVPGAMGAFVGAVILTTVASNTARLWMASILFLLGIVIIARFGFGRNLFPEMQRTHATPLAGGAGRRARGCHRRRRLGPGGDAVTAHLDPTRAPSRGGDGQRR